MDGSSPEHADTGNTYHDDEVMHVCKVKSNAQYG